MSSELAYTDHSNAGSPHLYAVLQTGVQTVNASTGALQSLSSGNWQSSAITLDDTGHAGHYLANVPTNTPAGRYRWKTYTASGTPASTATINDTEASATQNVLDWDGAAEVTLADILANAEIASSMAAQTAIILAGGGTPGASQCTLTMTDDNDDPIPDADVWVTSDAEGTHVVQGTYQTNSAGQVRFMLDAGVTYYLWLQCDGHNPIMGQPFTAVADT